MQPRGIAMLSSMCLVLLCCVACTQKSPETKLRPVPASSQATPANTEIDASRILKFRGALTDHEGKRVTGVVGVLFAIYEQKEGGAPLWQEVQNVEGDKRGLFAALVGSTKSEGIPPELFRAEKALWLSEGTPPELVGTESTRWLGIQLLLPDEVELPRIRLVRTPHGLRGEYAVRPIIPEKSGDQAGEAQTQQASSETVGSRQDQSGPTNRPRRARRRLHRSP